MSRRAPRSISAHALVLSRLRLAHRLVRRPAQSPHHRQQFLPSLLLRSNGSMAHSARDWLTCLETGQLRGIYHRSPRPRRHGSAAQAVSSCSMRARTTGSAKDPARATCVRPARASTSASHRFWISASSRARFV
jgi:hypothetical protein